MSDADRFPGDDTLVIHFAHVAYRLAERFALRGTGIAHFQTWSREDTLARIAEGHVLVLSGFWSDGMLDQAANLRFVQVCAAGYDRFGLDALRERGVRLANGSGVNRNAVSDHAMALLLALARHLHTGRDRQRAHEWRGMISDLGRREEELAGKTMVIYGLGAIGSRLARLARAFDMKVIGIKRDTAHHDGSADEVRSPDRFLASLAEADVVALTCPLTPQTQNLIDAAALERMQPGAYLINVARGHCVNEPDLVAALERGAIAGAGIDTTWEEPLAPDSPLWDLENALITPHTAGRDTPVRGQCGGHPRRERAAFAARGGGAGQLGGLKPSAGRHRCSGRARMTRVQGDGCSACSRFIRCRRPVTDAACGGVRYAGDAPCVTAGPPRRRSTPGIASDARSLP